jgi:outer membrane protein OmpA-like peptidoglycan-associated protein
VEGLERFGGATALVDAAHEAVELLKKAEDYEKKAIVIFTDGLENSSVLTKAELIEEANELGVQIYTVGFGSEIDTSYLQDLAEATSGGNYRIYQTPDFLRIFQDVYQRMRNYYTISFLADSIGEFETIVDLCLPTGKDSLVFYFENDTLIPKVIIEEIPEDDYTDFEKIPKKGDVKLLHVNFKFGTTDITEASFPEVQKAIDYMKKFPKIIVELRGHTDYVGTEHFNLKLSRQRASAIKHKMLENGIDSHRIKTLGLGESEPIAPNDTEEGRALNRRTEFVILEE